MSKKDYVHIKANGLRNELKDIRKSLDALNQTILKIAQTHIHHEDTIDCGYGCNDECGLCRVQREDREERTLREDVSINQSIIKK